MRIFLLPALVCSMTTLAVAHPGGHGPRRTTPASANSTMKNTQVENEAAMENRGELLLAQRETRPRGGNARRTNTCTRTCLKLLCLWQHCQTTDGNS